MARCLAALLGVLFVWLVHSHVALGALAPADACKLAKIKATAKASTKALVCYLKALKRGDPVDPACLVTQDTDLAAAFAEAEAAGGCPTIGDAQSTSAGVVQPFANLIAARLPPPGAACACGATAPARLLFTTETAAGTCIDTTTFGGVTTSRPCGQQLLGGGANAIPPWTLPDLGLSLFSVTGCTDTRLVVENTTAVDTGSPRTCTSTGCLFGAPVSAPNPTTPPVSVCLINTVNRDASGTANCATGSVDVSMPVVTTIFLTGDLLPGTVGTQPCPACTGGICDGGPNHGLACTAGTSVAAGSTSHDCPPPPGLELSDVTPIDVTFTTGVVTRVAQPSGNQTRVFCGFCRDSDDTGAFQNPAKPCVQNIDCGELRCFDNLNGVGTAIPCTTPGGQDVCPVDHFCEHFESCEQRNNGAFGPAGGAVQTITGTGVAAGALATGGGPLTGKLAAVFCVRPTYDPTVDAALDLPGPGAITLQGAFELLP